MATVICCRFNNSQADKLVRINAGKLVQWVTTTEVSRSYLGVDRVNQ